MDSIPTEPAKLFLEFTSAGSTANAQMHFAHMLSTNKCKAFPTKGMITALFGGSLLPLDDAQGLGFNIFGLPSTSVAEPLSEQEMIQQQINSTDGTGVSREGAEKMSVTTLSPIYSFTDLRHRVKSLKFCYRQITGGNNYFADKIAGCVDSVDNLETEITRAQNKRNRYITELCYVITKKIILYTESCRDAEPDEPFVVRHLNFEPIWSKVEMGENFEITLPPCLETKFKKVHLGAPQDSGYGKFQSPGGRHGVKRGQDHYGRNQEDKGAVVHNLNPVKSLMVVPSEFASIIHNFVKHRENKKWVPTRNGIPVCLKLHCTGYCFEKCNFGHEALNPQEEHGLDTLVKRAKDFKASQRQQNGAGRGAGS